MKTNDNTVQFVDISVENVIMRILRTMMLGNRWRQLAEHGLAVKLGAFAHLHGTTGSIGRSQAFSGGSAWCRQSAGCPGTTWDALWL
jgi:hypothetical protein